MKKFLNEFKTFALKGNMMDLAVGMIIGSAFTSLVNSMVNELFMPILSLIVGKVDFKNLFFSLNGTHYDTLAAAQAADAPIFAYGAFITDLINFILMAFVVFLLVKGLNKMRQMTEHKPETPAIPAEKVCPFCKSSISIDATRCPHCTSQLETAVSDMTVTE